MNRLPQILIRPWNGLLVILGGSAVGGYAYRSALDNNDPSQLNPRTFVPFTLVSKKPVSPTSSIFTLRHHELHETRAVYEAWARGVWSVQVKQPQLQIARSYTPLPGEGRGDDYPSFDEELGEGLRLLVRREEGGEVSGYLHNLPEQSTVELRGPQIEFDIPWDVREVLFLAGGTGIAPALQVAALLARRLKDEGVDKGGFRMHILWANRHKEDCLGGKREGVEPLPLGKVSGWRSLFELDRVSDSCEIEAMPRKSTVVAELEQLRKYYTGKSSMKVEYFVDDENNFIQKINVLRALIESKQEEASPERPQAQQQEEPESKKLIFVSGPDGFIKHWAGKKLWVGSHETQGVLGGTLGELDIKGWMVRKL